MPNIKIFVDEAKYEAARGEALMQALRRLVCAELSVPPAACQLAILPVQALADQPQVNAELAILRHPDRGVAVLQGLAQKVQDLVAADLGLSVAVRITSLDPAHYLALK